MMHTTISVATSVEQTGVGLNIWAQEFIPQQQFVYITMPSLDVSTQSSTGLFKDIGAFAVRGERRKMQGGHKSRKQLDCSASEVSSTHADPLAEADWQSGLNPPWRSRALAVTEDPSLLELIRAGQMQLKGDEATQQMSISTIRDRFLDFAFGKEGCRLVQDALEIASQRDKINIAGGLRGHVRRAVESPYANYVLQKIIEVLQPSAARFILDELLGLASEVARHEYGCRIICRLLEHPSESTNDFVAALLMDAKNLSEHVFGHIAIRHILEHGDDCQRASVASALRGNLEKMAKMKHASLVVQSTLAAYRGQPIRMDLANELLDDPQTIARLANNQFGHHIVLELMREPGDCANRTLDIIGTFRPLTKHGKRCLKRLEVQK